MGNTTVKPTPTANFFTPVYDTVPPDPNAPYIVTYPTNFPSNNDDFTAPTTSPIPHTTTPPTNNDSSAAHTKSPIPHTTTSPTNNDSSTAPTKSPTPPNAMSPTNIDNPTVSPKSPISPTTTSPTNNNVFAVSTKSPTPRITTPPTNINKSTIPTKSFTPPVPSNSFSSSVPIAPTTFNSATAPITSSTLAISDSVSPTPTIHDISIKLPNFTPVVSPDSSVVSPTIENPVTPITSPTHRVPALPINPTTSFTEFRPIAPPTPKISVVPSSPIKSTTPRSFEVAPKRTLTKTSISLSTSTREQAKPTTLSSVDRWNKWNQFEQKQREKHKKFSQANHQIQRSDSLTSSLSNTDDNQNIFSIPPDIVAVPSYALRSTAVSNLPPEERMLSERTQSIHRDISIFKYYLTQKETKQSIGNHTKATMFKMNTLAKQTPFPIPTLSLINKNFSDGTHELNENSKVTPTFGSLGLRNDIETESINQSTIKLDRNKKEQQQQQKTLSISDLYANSDDSLQYVSSTFINPPTYSFIENPSLQNNRQPLTSILKKSSSQVNYNPYSTQTNNKLFQDYRKNDFENYSSVVSFNMPSPKIKPSQSILRSEKLFSKRSFFRKK